MATSTAQPQPQLGRCGLCFEWNCIATQELIASHWDARSKASLPSLPSLPSSSPGRPLKSAASSEESVASCDLGWVASHHCQTRRIAAPPYQRFRRMDRCSFLSNRLRLNPVLRPPSTALSHLPLRHRSHSSPPFEVFLPTVVDGTSPQLKDPRPLSSA
jgi:hypothetical protein